MSKTWLITGSSRGFGKELARAVLERGDHLVATARRREQLQYLVDQYGEQVRTFPLDVTDAHAAAAAIDFAVREFGSLDVVVNNAGFANSSPIEEMTDVDFRAQVEANLFGTVNVTKAALPVMRSQRSGVIVQFSSVGGRVGGTPGMGAYQTAKFAVEGFSEVLANEVKPLGIRVMIVEPGAFRTDWQGASMKLAPVGPDYEQTVGAMNTYRAANSAKEPGDPARAAQIIVDTVHGGDLPMRLVLGAGALGLIRKAAEVRAAETEKWATVSASADFPADA
ncbi:oxidoreductase [Orlajensenia leifsoniae]|uniref:SDR family NAD(P)-dependent oxidoreductase n=1 Tax=Orlajensenia leifsoniae TaxID=2561933 RepID=A0A4Y9R9J1_9MICO|nr:oxidoreductase [Leifsonia flava]TFW00184.1 SDR family NAD(P)-dependent oxidoreductase [Leifsonia flava]